jgi:hypothetical protein
MVGVYALRLLVAQPCANDLLWSQKNLRVRCTRSGEFLNRANTVVNLLVVTTGVFSLAGIYNISAETGFTGYHREK